MKFKKLLILATIVILQFAACSVKYSLSGVSTSAKTFSVQYIEILAPKAQPSVSDVFTDGIKDKFSTQAGLTLQSKKGDLEFSGSITQYSETYVGVTSAQEAAAMRLTITLKIKFVNNLEPEKSFEKSYTKFRDVDAETGLGDVEETFITEMAEEIIDEIFVKTVADW